MLGAYCLYCEGDVPLLFIENSTNHRRLGLDYPDIGPYLKDGINDYVVQGRTDDVNPPVHSFATLFLHRSEQALRGETDVDFLKLAFNKLLLNFTWWVNRKDRFGKNVFEGGFLGLDNIGVFDRSAPLPTGGYLEQADGTAWMALFTQNMLELKIELGRRPVYGGTEKFQTDPHWRDHILFYEYFHGDNGGAGCQPPDRLDRNSGETNPAFRVARCGKDARKRQGCGLPPWNVAAGGKAMNPWPKHPVIYEINTWVWLNELSRKCERPVTLAAVPSEEWDHLSSLGADAVWFMGVWERSPAGTAIANQNKGLQEDFRRALPDFRPEDNVGSPYCVRQYVVDKHLGGRKGADGLMPTDTFQKFIHFAPVCARRWPLSAEIAR